MQRCPRQPCLHRCRHTVSVRLLPPAGPQAFGGRQPAAPGGALNGRTLLVLSPFPQARKFLEEGNLLRLVVLFKGGQQVGGQLARCASCYGSVG